MKFTIIITSFNKEKYLKDCIESCLNQSNKNYEVILCDNYSEDNSAIIFEKFKNSIQIIKKKKISSSGPVNQMDLIKIALNNSSGEYICLLDGDDYFQKDKIKTLEKYFNKNKNLNIIFDIPEIKKKNSLQKLTLKKKYQKNIWPTIINTSSITIKKEFLVQFFKNQLYKNFDLLEIDFRLNAFSRCVDKNFLIIDEKLTVYRYVEDSIINSFKKFSKKWWVKRLQAHEFMNYIFTQNNLSYKNYFDRFCTIIFSNILK